MKLRILHIQEYLHFYYLYLNDMVNDILEEQTEHLKDLIEVFQKLVWLIDFGVTVSEILRIEISENW